MSLSPQPVFFGMFKTGGSFRKDSVTISKHGMPAVLLSTGLNHTHSSEALRLMGSIRAGPAEILNAASATAVF